MYIYISHIQGISEKCTGAFKFGCLILLYFEVSIYPKVAAKTVSSVYLSIEFTQKNIHIMF